ncbi:MAG: hypothetical protein HY815_30580, partial [Candidatus Riflebacteria bacterium]|nr:hypothetical protein [Candidatus Riflebacteria bacterium]
DELAQVLNQLRVGSAPRDGLTELHRSLESKGLPERLRAIRPLIRFLDEDSERYLEMASYLAQDELDVPARPEYAELSLRLGTLRSWLDRPETCLEKDSLDRFVSEFDLFLEGYQSAYTADHQAKRAPASLCACSRIGGSAPFRMLDALCRSPLALPPAPFQRLKAGLETAARYQCTRLTPFALKSRPVCPCGHRLGEKPPVPPGTTLQEWLEEALREVVRELSSPARVRELERARGQLEECGETREAAAIEELSALTPGASDLSERISRMTSLPLPRALDRVAQLQRAVDRDLKPLTDQLLGKILTRKKILQIVHEWIGTEVDEQTAIRVAPPKQPLTGGSTTGLDPGRWPAVAGLAAERGPGPAFALCLLSRWALAHEIPPAAAARVTGVVPPEQDVYEELGPAGAALIAELESGELQEIVDRFATDEIQARLFDLIAGGAGPAQIVRRLELEPLFVEIARRLAVLALTALSASGPGDEPRPAGEVAPTGDRPAPPAVRAEVARFRDLVRAATALWTRLGALESRKGKVPTTHGGWEERFQRFAGVPLELSRLLVRAEDLGVESELAATGLEARCRALFDREAREFEPVYRALVPTIWEQGAGPCWMHRVVPGRIARLRRELAPPSVRLVMVDAMRWDFYRLIERELTASRDARMRKLEESSVWSLAPTVSSVNVPALLSGTPPSPDQVLVEWQDDEHDRSGEAMPCEAPGLEFLKLGQLDEAVHSSTQPLAHLYDSVAPTVLARLASVVAGAKVGTLVVLVADHGFAENPAFRPHGQARRWRHGGLDPFEVLVPLAVFQKL